MTFAWWHAFLWLLPLAPTFWSIWHIWRHDFADPARRMLWLCLVVFLPVLGGVIYIFTGRREARPLPRAACSEARKSGDRHEDEAL